MAILVKANAKKVRIGSIKTIGTSASAFDASLKIWMTMEMRFLKQQTRQVAIIAKTKNIPAPIRKKIDALFSSSWFEFIVELNPTSIRIDKIKKKTIMPIMIIQMTYLVA